MFNKNTNLDLVAGWGSWIALVVAGVQARSMPIVQRLIVVSNRMSSRRTGGATIIRRIINTTSLSEPRDFGTYTLRNQEQEQASKDWDGDDIEDTIEDILSDHWESVGPLAQAPSNWVCSPSDEEKSSQEGVCFLGADVPRVLHTPDQNEVGENEICEDSEGIISPFVACGNKGTTEPRHDPDFLKGNDEEKSSPADTAEKEDGSENEWPGGDVIYVSDVEDLASLRFILTVIHVLSDWCVAKIWGYGEVWDESDEGSNCEEVMEDTLFADSGCW